MTQERIITEAFQTEVKAEDYVHVNGKYTNLILNDYKGQSGIQPGEYIRVQKHNEYNGPYTNEREATGKDGKRFKYNMHQCKALVSGQEVSFVLFSGLDQEEHEAKAFEEVAGLEDVIEISKEEYSYVDNNGKKRLKERLVFRKVE